ncbi:MULTISPECIES: hypothetical protein [unclassified Paenibacillus]|uniref:hypothetical protein n=1 Tax=unclassified Paenibacillus TaxID=185978 RepID=UPI000CFB5F5D|nr:MULTISPECIES: hypothetical protein [unclassified Paenibacillus]PRA04812.1 hypothetical protein CQ043_12190 [Paenibacillus sp. MYb63]PRA47843.1 hypothetical protein CQ061_14640 [Paenibacillus sp. MYb67]
MKKPIYKKWWFWLIVVIVVGGIFGNQNGETDETNAPVTATVIKEETEIKATVENKSTDSETDSQIITADNAYTWLKESGLISSEAKDVTDKFEGSEGLVKALRTDEADIMEFEKDENAAKYHNPNLNSYAVKNIYILIKKGQDNAENFVKILESGKTLTVETLYASDEQKKVAELIESDADFLPTVEAYFALQKDQKSSTWDTFMVNKFVTWSGTIADSEIIGDSLVVYGGENYTAEDWSTISTEKKDMMPYTFIVELKDNTMKDGLKKGDKVKLKASLDSRGDKEMQLNWKLYEGEVVE